MCSCCHQPLTANWSKGRSSTYPYYLCRHRGCPENGKSIPRSRIEGEFEELLTQLAPSPQLLKLAAHLFRDLWDQKIAAGKDRKRALKAQLSQIERKIEQLLDLLIESDRATDTEMFKKRMREQEQQKALVEDKIARCGTPLAPFDESFRTALDFIGNPQKMWDSDHLEDKRALLKLAFSGNLIYARNEGFRTADFSFPFKVLGEEKPSEKLMVRPTGFEPVAPRLGI
ncbi:MAG: hypothetical protein AB7G24_07790 [Novosphingobium sp.]